MTEANSPTNHTPGNMMPNRPVTRTQWAESQLRQMILDGVLAPKERIVLAKLAEQLEMSPSPIREALARLSMEHLVELTPHGSAVVAEISIPEALEVYQLRLLIEPTALAASVGAATEGDRAAWRAAFNLLDSGPEPIDNLRHHARFHRSLMSSCPSTWILRTIAPLQDYAMRMVVVVAPQLPATYHIRDDHEQLLNLAVDGDSEGAEAHLREHLQRSYDIFRSNLSDTTDEPA